MLMPFTCMVKHLPTRFLLPHQPKAQTPHFRHLSGLRTHMFDKFSTEETVPGQACGDQNPREHSMQFGRSAEGFTVFLPTLPGASSDLIHLQQPTFPFAFRESRTVNFCSLQSSDKWDAMFPGMKSSRLPTRTSCWMRRNVNLLFPRSRRY